MPVNLDINGFFNRLHIILKLTIGKLNRPLDVLKSASWKPWGSCLLRQCQQLRKEFSIDSIVCAAHFEGTVFLSSQSFLLITWLCPPPSFPGMCSISTASSPLANPSVKCFLFCFLTPIDFFMEVKLCRGNYLKNWAPGYYISKNFLPFSSIIWQNKFPGAIVRG